MAAPFILPRPTLGSMRGLDRCAERRGDTAWVTAQTLAAATRYLLLVDFKLSVAETGERSQAAIRWYDRDYFAALSPPPEPILLGCEPSGAARFAVSLSAAQALELPGGAAACEPLVDLRTLAVQGALSGHELAIAGEARAMATWHASHRCCGRCGAYTKARDAGWRRQCRSCGASAFPRADPAIITLITHGERCLLAHHRRFSEPRYTVLAGFVEPGEDIEDAVRREVREEAGVEVGEVRYLGSQPWPFPHNLMLGCWGEALSAELRLDSEELVDAVWASREEARMILDGTHPKGWVGPGPFSIACMLIRSFVEAR